jgi:hypothetical protein
MAKAYSLDLRENMSLSFKCTISKYHHAIFAHDSLL